MIKRPSRTTQHKTTRDERKKNQDIQDLKKEIKTLKTALARARKQATKPEVVIYEVEESPLPDLKEDACVKCGEVNYDSLTLPSGTVLIICHACGMRSKRGNPDSGEPAKRSRKRAKT